MGSISQPMFTGDQSAGQRDICFNELRVFLADGTPRSWWTLRKDLAKAECMEALGAAAGPGRDRRAERKKEVGAGGHGAGGPHVP